MRKDIGEGKKQPSKNSPKALLLYGIIFTFDSLELQEANTTC